jgi:hypothetical protein
MDKQGCEALEYGRDILSDLTSHALGICQFGMKNLTDQGVLIRRQEV